MLEWFFMCVFPNQPPTPASGFPGVPVTCSADCALSAGSTGRSMAV